MKTLNSILAFAALGAALLSTTGCKVAAKSASKFVGTPVTKTVDYQKGGELTIDGVYGDIAVSSGAAAGKVEVTFQPFAYEGYDDEDKAVRAMNEGLVLNVDLTGGVHVTASRNSSGNGLGSGISVKLPAEFDGKISVHNRGEGALNEFDSSVDWVGAAPSVSIINDQDLGSCRVKGAPTVTSTTVTCGEIEVTNVSDNVNLTQKGLGTDASIVLTLAGISATATGGSVTTNDGSIDATFPATGTYAIEAWAKPSNGVVSGTPPASCTTQETSAGSKTFTCGGATPLYKLTAGEDSVGDSNINLSFK